MCYVSHISVNSYVNLDKGHISSHISTRRGLFKRISSHKSDNNKQRLVLTKSYGIFKALFQISMALSGVPLIIPCSQSIDFGAGVTFIDSTVLVKVERMNLLSVLLSEGLEQ